MQKSQKITSSLFQINTQSSFRSIHCIYILLSPTPFSHTLPGPQGETILSFFFHNQSSEHPLTSLSKLIRLPYLISLKTSRHANHLGIPPLRPNAPPSSPCDASSSHAAPPAYPYLHESWGEQQQQQQSEPHTLSSQDRAAPALHLLCF